MPLSEKARIEVYIPDLPQQTYQNLLNALAQEFTYTFGGSTIIRGLDGSYLSRVGVRMQDRIHLIYADTPFALAENFESLSRYTDALREAAFEALTEETILVVVLQVYQPSEHICGEYGAPDRPNTALEATGHSVRFMAGVGLYRVARASAWAFGVSPSNVVHRRVSLHTGIHRICISSAARTTRSGAGSSRKPASKETEMASEFLRDVPVASPDQKEVWGSDAIAAMLRALDIPYLALNPGASYRGLHDSIVNYLGNDRPQMLLCLHEESAVAIAHGYARVAGQMMGVVLHSNVGLMHGTMAIFNAWCDRVPMLVLGATGPWDAAKRRPWIDWLHTTSDQGALVRDYTKWDNQPASVPAAFEALLRAVQIADTAPRGPTYVNLDAALQEAKIGPMPALPDVARFKAPAPVLPAQEVIEQAARLLSAAKNPVILAGRASRAESDWKNRVAVAEKLNAQVMTDLKGGAAFPTDHPLHPVPPAAFLSDEGKKLLRAADVVLSLDWIDTAGTLKQAWGAEPIGAQVILVSPDAHSHRGWSMDYQGLPPADVYMMCEPDPVLPLLLSEVQSRVGVVSQQREAPQATDEALSIRALANAFNEATRGLDVCLSRLPLGWHGAYRHFRHPLDYLGADGGGGVGAGPGLIVGTALALKDSRRIAAGILGDGDFLMGVTALWTATHYKVPCLLVVANNRSFYNDELHQERVAKERARPVENKWIGQRIDEPDLDLAMMARAQGAVGIGPVTDLSELKKSLEKAIEAVRNGQVCVVDVRVVPGYDTNMSGAASAARR